MQEKSVIRQFLPATSTISWPDGIHRTGKEKPKRWL